MSASPILSPDYSAHLSNWAFQKVFETQNTLYVVNGDEGPKLVCQNLFSLNIRAWNSIDG